MDKETVCNPLTHIFLLEMKTQWTLPSSAKPQLKKKRKNIVAPVDASIAEGKVTSHTIAPANQHTLILSK